VSFEIENGQIVSIVGKNGSGKSKLFHVLAGFMNPELGSIQVANQETALLSESEHAACRLNYFGFIFQKFQLMPVLTAFENMKLPLKLKGIPNTERQMKRH